MHSNTFSIERYEGRRPCRCTHHLNRIAAKTRKFILNMFAHTTDPLMIATVYISQSAVCT